MSNGNTTTGGSDPQFVEHLRQRAERKREEYYQLLHDQRKLGVLLERTRKYIEQLNQFLEYEGVAPVEVKEPSVMPKFSRPGNRAPDMPLRRPEWEGQTLNDIVPAILGAATLPLHANEIARRIYDIATEKDLKRVSRTLVSTLRRGAKNGLWQGLKGNRYFPSRDMKDVTHERHIEV